MNAVVDFIRLHWAVAAALVLPTWHVATGIATLIIGWKTDAEWAALIERAPHTVRLVRFIRASGTDVPGVVRALRGELTPPAPPPTPITKPGAPPPPPEPPPAAARTYGYQFFGWTIPAVLVLVGWLVTACGIPPATVAEDVAYGICVLDIAAMDLAAGVPASKVAADAAKRCGGSEAQAASLLAAHQRAMDATRGLDAGRDGG